MWSVYIPLYIYNVVARKYVKNFDKGTRHTLFLRARSMSMCVCVLYDMSRHHKLIYRQIKHCKVRDRSPGHSATINTTLWAKEISKAGVFFREINFTKFFVKLISRKKCSIFNDKFSI